MIQHKTNNNNNNNNNLLTNSTDQSAPIVGELGTRRPARLNRFY
jgi:hypothetical protein